MVGRLTRRRPRGAAMASCIMARASSSSSRMRRQRSWNRAPSCVSRVWRVVRLNRRTPSCCSSRATFLPTAEAEMPSSRPALAKLSRSAARTKDSRPAKLSILATFGWESEDQWAILISLNPFYLRAFLPLLESAPRCLAFLCFRCLRCLRPLQGLPSNWLLAAVCLAALGMPLSFTGPAVVLPACMPRSAAVRCSSTG
jgi:hypothetical protein